MSGPLLDVCDGCVQLGEEEVLEEDEEEEEDDDFYGPR
jgi:hypothetical protein